MTFTFSVEAIPETKNRTATIRIKTNDTKHETWVKFMAYTTGETQKMAFWDTVRKYCTVGDPHGPGLIVVAGGLVCTSWEPMDVPGVVWRQCRLRDFKDDVLKCMTYDDGVTSKSNTLTLSVRNGTDRAGKAVTWSMNEINSVAKAIHVGIKSL